jgi:hypothetical protein
MINYFREWLSEGSTWTGLFFLLASFNVASFTADQKLAIQMVGVSLVARHGKMFQ